MSCSSRNRACWLPSSWRTTSDLDTNEDSTSTTSISSRPPPHTSATAARVKLPPNTESRSKINCSVRAQPLIGPADHGVHQLLLSARAWRLQDAELALQGVGQLVDGQHIGSGSSQFQSQWQPVKPMADAYDSVGRRLVEPVVDQ